MEGEETLEAMLAAQKKQLKILEALLEEEKDNNQKYRQYLDTQQKNNEEYRQSLEQTSAENVRQEADRVKEHEAYLSGARLARFTNYGHWDGAKAPPFS